MRISDWSSDVCSSDLFSFLGIMLGVATLIIVMSVMNGFRAELLGRILGLNGHLTIQSEAALTLHDYDRIAGAVGRLPGVVLANPMIEGQVMGTANNTAAGVQVRGVRGADLMQIGRASWRERVGQYV